MKVYTVTNILHAENESTIDDFCIIWFLHAKLGIVMWRPTAELKRNVSETSPEYTTLTTKFSYVNSVYRREEGIR